MPKFTKSTPVGREAYLRKFLETAKELGMLDDPAVIAARDEYIALLDSQTNRAIVRAGRAAGLVRLRDRRPDIEIIKSLARV